MKIWEVHYAFRPQSPRVLVDGMTIHRAAYGVYHPNYDHHVYRNLAIIETDTEPFNRGHDDQSVQYGPLTVDGLTFDGISGYADSMPLIQISDNNPTGTAVSHFRNVQVVNRKDKGRRPLANLGGGPRPPPHTPRGVPIYLLDHFGPGRHAKVVSTRARDLMGDGDVYRADPPLTGDLSRVAEVRDVAFPTPARPGERPAPGDGHHPRATGGRRFAPRPRDDLKQRRRSRPSGSTATRPVPWPPTCPSGKSSSRGTLPEGNSRPLPRARRV